MQWDEIIELVVQLRSLKTALGMSMAAPLSEVSVIVSNPDQFRSLVFDIAGCMNIQHTHIYNLKGEYQWTHKHTRH